MCPDAPVRCQHGARTIGNEWGGGDSQDALNEGQAQGVEGVHARPGTRSLRPALRR